MRVFEGIAIRVPSILETESGWIAVEEISEAPEFQAPAEIGIKDLRDGGAAELVAELDVVLSVFPRDVVDVMPVGVVPVARGARAGPELRKAAGGDNHDGQPEIHPGSTCIQVDAGRIEVAILRVKTFRKTVPADTRFIYDRWRENRNVRDADQLYARGGKRIVA